MADKSQFGLTAVDTVPLHEKVYLELVRALMSGQLRPGQKLTSRKLAKELGTSDMPVRSAFMRLQALRALSPMPNGSVEVPLISADRFQQLTAVRTVLEGTATELATKLINGNNLRAIRRHCAELTEAARSGGIENYLRKNYDFKFSIYRHCGNEQMIFLIETVWMQVGPFLRNLHIGFEDDLAGILGIDYHEEVVAAIEAGDGERARTAIVRDIAEGAAHILGQVKFPELRH
ncbi:GntR family transcriptional regulator [Mesorhizobium sp. CA18]|uniref:GntR family transcriptional regulator n=1 Tax=unclassified Mesorhizobium TaxID=325217 RepID=UPI001CCDC501|nr:MULTISPECIES: GntR family transcriptional regulator [unclassified Mesorhizobium]MBZ9735048.1 GntR family transcriptional regulator [Mesorhizobium sp. CA9]MBZ9828502.1 GntR family transcriptional regulator [Mesorhizobium sp. CA18]MBZ9834877.1 GntR family transcriptional regulator [Mesorhizobium sp. CA2]MBZ9840596.1 GntR family transcriptional regulator [Mesorhizobium sp. CA3]MBZ9879519.1 GntR family transcriptional regulator [Mesorhizobium sp. Ca11]